MLASRLHTLVLMAIRVLILGAAGRDFHNFNVVYRDDPVAVQPTYLWPMIAGGFILGAGFALGGY